MLMERWIWLLTVGSQNYVQVPWIWCPLPNTILGHSSRLLMGCSGWHQEKLHTRAWGSENAMLLRQIQVDFLEVGRCLLSKASKWGSKARMERIAKLRAGKHFQDVNHSLAQHLRMLSRCLFCILNLIGKRFLGYQTGFFEGLGTWFWFWHVANNKGLCVFFKALSDGEVGQALLPMENSTGGTVHDVYKLLPEYGLHITGEYSLGVDHCLLGKKGSQISDIRKVISHWQVRLWYANHGYCFWADVRAVANAICRYSASINIFSLQFKWDWMILDWRVERPKMWIWSCSVFIVLAQQYSLFSLCAC